MISSLYLRKNLLRKVLISNQQPFLDKYFYAFVSFSALIFPPAHQFSQEYFRLDIPSHPKPAVALGYLWYHLIFQSLFNCAHRSSFAFSHIFTWPVCYFLTHLVNFFKILWTSFVQVKLTFFKTNGRPRRLIKNDFLVCKNQPHISKSPCENTPFDSNPRHQCHILWHYDTCMLKSQFSCNSSYCFHYLPVQYGFVVLCNHPGTQILFELCSSNLAFLRRVLRLYLPCPNRWDKVDYCCLCILCASLSACLSFLFDDSQHLRFVFDKNIIWFENFF